MSEELPLGDSTKRLIRELAEETGRRPQEIHDTLLYEGLKNLNGQNPDSHIGQVLLKLKNMRDETETLLRPPGLPPLSSIPKILKRR